MILSGPITIPQTMSNAAGWPKQTAHVLCNLRFHLHRLASDVSVAAVLSRKAKTWVLEATAKPDKWTFEETHINALEDPTLQGKLSQILSDLHAQGTTLIVVEHNLGFLMSLADSVVVLQNGGLLAQGAPDDIRRDPAVIAAYLGSDHEA